MNLLTYLVDETVFACSGCSCKSSKSFLKEEYKFETKWYITLCI